MRLLHVTVLLLLLCLSFTHGNLHAQDRPPSVDAELSQASITFGDSVTLTVTAQNMDKAIDLSSLNTQFNVIGRSSSREVRILNGAQSQLVKWVVQIEPKEAGVLTVPPIKVGDIQTQPLSLNVSGPPTGANRLLFVEASVDTENPYVQSQVLLTIKVWQSVRILESNKVNLGSDQFQTVSLERDKEYLDTRDGREYLVQEQQFALFPQASGVHTFGPIELRAKLPVDGSRVQGFFAPTRSVKRVSQPITLTVQPRPQSVQGQWWLPAHDVQITDSWSADPANIDANDTLTRTIEIIATGVSGDQLPDIEPPEIDGLKLYADNIDRSSVATDQGIVSTQRVTWAVLPERNGAVEVPPIKLGWFNTRSGQPEQAELPAQTVVVNGLVEQAAPIVATDSANDLNTSESGDADASALVGPVSTSAVEATQQPNWLWLLLGAASILLLQAIAFGIWKLRARRLKTKQAKGATRADATHIPSLNKVSQAAKSTQLESFQQAVMQWAQEFWPQTPPSNLLTVAQRLQEPKLQIIFTDVDAALYGHSEKSADLSEVYELMRTRAEQIVDAGEGKGTEIGSMLPRL